MWDNNMDYLFIFVSDIQGFQAVAYPGILYGEGGSTNSVEDIGQREWKSGDVIFSSQGFWRRL